MRECPNQFADDMVAMQDVSGIFGGGWADVGAQYSPPGESLVKALFTSVMISDSLCTR